MKAQQCESKPSLKCAHCDKQFKYDSERKRHEQSHSPQFMCKICSKKFSFVSALKRHQKQHERTGSVTCNECNRKFRDESLLKRHVKYAHKGSYTCTKCQATFNSDLALHSHMKTHKPESERKFRCSFTGCMKTFNFAHHLKHHELAHTNTKQHFCKICGKGFIQYHHLKSHVKTHEPASWLKCTLSSCKKTFANVYALKRHLGTHNDTFIGDKLPRPKSVGDGTNFNDSENTEDSITFESKSLCDVNELIESDSVFSASRSPINSLHVSKFSGYDLRKETQNYIDVSSKRNEYPIDASIGSYLGDRVKGADISNDSYPGIPSYIENPHIMTPNYQTEDSNLAMNFINKKPLNESGSTCKSCDCRSNTNVTVSISKCDSYKRRSWEMDNDAMPEIERKSDGTIKIKETFDVAIDLSMYESDRSRDTCDIIPINSCKAILGKCIVTGSGTIGEGCLCVRMAMDDQIIEQEIDELTPCPKT